MKKFPKLKERDIVLVKWQDAGGTGGWFNPSEKALNTREDELVVTEVGHFLKWRKRGIHLCEGYNRDSDGSYGPVAGSFIPRGCIISIKVLQRA